VGKKRVVYPYVLNQGRGKAITSSPPAFRGKKTEYSGVPNEGKKKKKQALTLRMRSREEKGGEGNDLLRRGTFGF